MEKMSRLLKAYGFNSDMQYFEMIVESIINGNRQQARGQFNAMPDKDKKNFVHSIYTDWQTGLDNEDKRMFLNNI